MRTIAEIYAEIVDNKDSQQPLQDLAPAADTEQELLAAVNSSSKVAIWRLWAYVVSVAIWTHEMLWEQFKKEVNEAASNAITGTVRWYQEEILKFQIGDLLTYNDSNGRYVYPVLNEANQIVKRCVVIERPNGILAVKVAKLETDAPVALTTSEQSSLLSYIKKIRFAGTKFTLVSGSGDILRIEATIYFDALVPSPTLQTAVEAAILSYVSNLPFNGQLILSKLTDEIQFVSGVNDVVLNSVKTKDFASNPYQDINRVFEPKFGYFVLDDSQGNTLTDTINFIAQ